MNIGCPQLAPLSADRMWMLRPPNEFVETFAPLISNVVPNLLRLTAHLHLHGNMNQLLVDLKCGTIFYRGFWVRALRG